MYQPILLILCLLTRIQHSIAVPALSPLNLTALEASAPSLGFHTNRCSPISPRTIRPGDCLAAVSNFYLRKNPGGALRDKVICTSDERRYADPAYTVLPDEEIFASCWVHWSLPGGTDVPVKWSDIFLYSRLLVQECIRPDSFGGVSLFGPDPGRVVRLRVVPAGLRAIEEGNGTATESVAVT